MMPSSLLIFYNYWSCNSWHDHMCTQCEYTRGGVAGVEKVQLKERAHVDQLFFSAHGRLLVRSSH
uniref:Uncharacterized protein n=1 Tax=Triticum urartu TaxID=4572 RepID=A0A8R7U801_TRIUA